MTTGEKQVYKRGHNNGFILGMASKGVVKVVEKSEKIQRGRLFTGWEMVEEWYEEVVEL